jgi:gluconolactonase
MYALDVDMTAPGFDRLVAVDAVLERVSHGLVFTEGPVWDARQGALVWTDIRGDKILKWVPGKGQTTILEPTGKANGLTLDAANRLVVAGWGSRTVWRWEPDGTQTVLAATYQGKKLNAPNDVVVKSDGSIWWTDPDGGLYIPGMDGPDVQKYLDFAGVYRVNPDGSGLTLVTDQVEGPNGLCFSPDESLLYVNDTPRRNIQVYEVTPDGRLKNGRVFYTDRGTEPGVPDGMKVDVEGNVYCTASAGIHVIEPGGQLLGRIKIPEHVANMAWGDSDFRTLYICAREVVYRVRLGIPGIPHGEANRQAILATASKRKADGK